MPEDTKRVSKTLCSQLIDLRSSSAVQMQQDAAPAREAVSLDLSGARIGSACPTLRPLSSLPRSGQLFTSLDASRPAAKAAKLHDSHNKHVP